MKLDKEKQQKLINSHDFEQGGFGIDQEDVPIVMNLLRNQIYSNKPLAVIREYSTNAVDAHIEAGIPERPIIITLPNKIESIFSVRDFGEGLSKDQIFNVYVKYCKSTKRQSNAFTGQLGIGCKSGFAYGDSFTIISYYEGKKSIYSASIDEKLSGSVLLMSSENTDEESGMEIIIPVEDKDINIFQTEAEKLLSFFDAPFEVKGITGFRRYDYTPDLSGDNWSISYSGDNAFSSAVAKMGNIGYKIDSSIIRNHMVNNRCYSFDERYTKILNFPGVRIFFNIGDLDISPSREGLEYTEKTKKHISEKIILVLEEMKVSFNKRFEDIKDYWEVRGKFNEYRTAINYSLRDVFGSSITWNGIRISDPYITLVNNYSNLPNELKSCNFYICSAKMSDLHKDGIRPEHVHGTSITCYPENKIIFLDKNSCMSTLSINRRLRTIFNSIEKTFETKMLLIEYDSDECIKFLKDKHHFDLIDESHFLNLEDYEESIGECFRDYTTGNTRQNVKLFKFHTAYNYGNTSDSWDDVNKEDIPDCGVYIKINRYKPCDKNGEYNSLSYKILRSFINTYNVIQKAKNLPLLTVYGVRYKDEKKLIKNGWIELGDLLKQKEEFIISKKKIKDSVKYEVIQMLNNCSFTYSRVNNYIYNNFNKHLLNKYIEVSKKYSEKKHSKKLNKTYDYCSNFYHILKSLGVIKFDFNKLIQKNKRKNDLINLKLKKINVKYPLHSTIIDCGYPTDEELSHFKNYVSAMDELGELREKFSLET
jgi:hypothetical protein